MSTSNRKRCLDRLYELLSEARDRINGPSYLGNCDGYMDWPDRGIYFFFAKDETRANSDQPRITRVGTHAVSEGSQTTLWNRLRTHRGALSGSYEGGGNHRGSVFRKRVGEAIIERENLHDEYPEWGVSNTADRELRENELPLERRVSEYIRELPFLYVEVDDEPSPDSQRSYIEANSIALLSNYQRTPIDERAENWLGRHSPRMEIKDSGLWNINHVDEEYDSRFLKQLENYIELTSPPSSL